MRKLSFTLALVLMLGTFGLANQPGYCTALKQRQARLKELKAALQELPDVTFQMQALERELQQLQLSTGRKPPELRAPSIVPPKLTVVQPVDMSRFNASQQQSLQELDSQIQDLEAQLPVLLERRSRTALLQSQIKLMRK